MLRLKRNLINGFSGANLVLLAIITSAAIALIAATVIGIKKGADDPANLARKIAADPSNPDLIDPDDPSVTIDPATGLPTGPGGALSPDGSPTNRPGSKISGPGGGSLPSTPGATREGITTTHIKIGVHAPLTIGGVPLNLAEDPVTGVKGYITHVNRNGGIHGRKIRMFLEDDRYETNPGGTDAGRKLVNEVKPFIISGTLGVDQINVVVNLARAASIPYMAVGGPEPEWRDIGMYQLGSSYDQYVEALARYICSRVEKGDLKGQSVRIGTTTLDTPFILPVEKRFSEEWLPRCGITVDSRARTKILKPTQQSSYSDQRVNLQTSYNGLGANLLVPLQDPVSTSRQVSEWTARSYSPKWTFSNFAHDGDTTLALMARQWVGMRGLSGSCSYQYAQAFNPALCAHLDRAHANWVGLGNVTYDEDVSGSKGSLKGSYDYTEGSWVTDGQGGGTGYQLVSFWAGALNAIGPDPTREKFIAALNAYDGFDDLITAPITFKGSPNKMHGASKFVVIEGQSNDKYRQVADLTPGLVDQF